MLYTHGLLSSWGFETEAAIEADASSAIAMASRRGVGRGRHLDLKWLLFPQPALLEKVRLVKVSEQDHVADVGARHFPTDALNEYKEVSGCTTSKRMADSPPGQRCPWRRWLSRRRLAARSLCSLCLRC